MAWVGSRAEKAEIGETGAVPARLDAMRANFILPRLSLIGLDPLS